MVYEIKDRHPFTGRLYSIFRERDEVTGKKKIRLKWCKYLNCFGVQAWFSNRIWIINGKITVLQ